MNADVQGMVERILASMNPWDTYMYRTSAIDWTAFSDSPSQRFYRAGWKPCFIVGEQPCTTRANSVDGWVYG